MSKVKVLSVSESMSQWVSDKVTYWTAKKYKACVGMWMQWYHEKNSTEWKKIDGVESQKICTVNSAKNHGMSPQVRYILSQINWKWTIQQKFKVLKKLLKSKKVRVEISKRMWILSHIRYCLWHRKWK